MPHPQIKFGTDGWRGVIADDFTFANVRIAAAAIAAYIHAQEDPGKGPLHRLRHALRIEGLCARLRRGGRGHRHSRRARQRHHAHAGAELWRARARRRRRHHDHLVAQSRAVERREVQGLVRRLGQAVDHRGDRDLSRQARAAGAARPRRLPRSISCHLSRGHRELRRSRSDCKVGHEVLPSTRCTARARTILSDIFTRIGVDHVQIRGNPDPLFPGINPEPIEPHIRALGEAVVGATTAMRASAPTAMPTASARPTSMATSSIRTRFSRCC